jgi:hypothetical protein
MHGASAFLTEEDEATGDRNIAHRRCPKRKSKNRSPSYKEGLRSTSGVMITSLKVSK